MFSSGVRPAQVRRWAGSEGECTDELALRAPIAFAERMHGVDLAEVVPGTQSEGVKVQLFQVILGLEVGEDAFERRHKKLRRWKAERGGP